MNVWAIADLHLSFANPERRDRYAARWRDHANRIEVQWRKAVADEDLVLLPGDLSMARNHRDVQPDLAWLERLPGTKVLSAGNHDAWWNGAEKIRPLLRPSLRAVGGDAIVTPGAIVCGTRGAPPPGDHPDACHQALIEGELAELERAFQSASRLRAGSGLPLYLLWHYPPFDALGGPGPWVSRFEAAGVSACVYGHLHTQSQWSRAVQGIVRGVRYYCVAADAVGFRPLRIDSR
ncbi:MAG: metallophosphoesterase [Isosphaeraceae bacterium]